MTPTPRTNHQGDADPEGDKRRALGQVAAKARSVRTANAALEAALLFARDQGATVRQLEEAAGIPRSTLARTLDGLDRPDRPADETD